MNQKVSVFSPGEEIANTITHGVMAALALIALPFASARAYARGGAVDAIGVSIFVASIFLMFMASCLYHAMQRDSRHKEVFRALDHMFIYVAIAGSYTPLALSVIRGWQGTVIIAVQWAMVLFGILYKLLSKSPVPKASLAIYLVMGWTVVFFFPVFLANATTGLLVSILVGGVLYSLGTLFYKYHWFRYHHMIWHIAVNLGALAHFVGIVFLLK